MLNRLLPLAGVSTLALVSAAFAQEAAPTRTVTLDAITLVADGSENIESTGGVVVTREDVQNLAPTDVSELFARQSALSVSGGAGPSKRIHVFGIEQSKLAVSVDGVPQGPTSWHHTGSNIIDPAFLKSVDVEAGAAAADAGFGAAAGAIRYETVGARDMLENGKTQGGRAALSYGSNGRGLGGSIAGYGVYGGMDWFAMIHGQNGKNYRSGNGHEMPGSEPAAKGALVKLGYEAEGHRVELALEHSRDDADRVMKMNMDLNGDRGVHRLKSSRDTVSLSYRSTNPTDIWDPEVKIYASSNGYWRPNYIVGDLIGGKDARPNGDMLLDRDTFGGVIKNRFTLAQGSITTGVDFAQDDYRVDNYGDHSTAQPRVRDFSTRQVGVFAQGRFEFDNGFDLSTGLRYDQHQFTDWKARRFSDSGASANATVSYRVTDSVEVFAGASKTWLGFEIGEYGLLHARNDAFTTDPNFKPASAQNYKVGINVGSGDWKAGLTLFDTRIDGAGSYDVEKGYLTNGKEIRSKGVTLNGSYAWANGRVGASFTKADVTSNGEEVLPSGGSIMPIGNVASVYVDHALPQHNLKLGATVEWSGKLSSTAMTAAGFKDHKSYTVVNTYAEWTPPQLGGGALRLGVDNLFDENYYERTSYVERAMGTRDIQPALAPGRTVTLGAAFKF